MLRPLWAVGWAAAFNFIAYFVFETKVAAMIGTGIVDPAIVDHYVIFGALVGAIVWNLITLVLRHSLELVTCADWRPCRRRRGEGRHGVRW